ncbi:MAG: hypothetical protein ACRERX_09350 [Pseudomonas sp.]
MTIEARISITLAAAWCLLGCEAPSEPTLEARFSAVEVNGQPVPDLLYVRDADWKITLLEATIDFERAGRYRRTVRVRYDTRDSVYVQEIVDSGRYRVGKGVIALASEMGRSFDTLLDFSRPESLRQRYELMPALVTFRRNPRIVP